MPGAPGAPQQWSVEFVEFVDASGKVVQRIGGQVGAIAPKLSAPYTPGPDGKLEPKYWAANKATELHWFQGAMAHAKWDGSIAVTEADFDEAVEGAQGITCGIQAHHPGTPGVVAAVAPAPAATPTPAPAPTPPIPAAPAAP